MQNIAWLYYFLSLFIFLLLFLLKYFKYSLFIKTFEGNYLKWICLAVLIIQNASTILLLRYVRTVPGDMFLSTTAIVCQEIIKIITSVILLFLETNDLAETYNQINIQIIKNPIDSLKTGVPAFLYTIQTNLVYVAISNLDAAVFQVCSKLNFFIIRLSLVFIKSFIS